MANLIPIKDIFSDLSIYPREVYDWLLAHSIYQAIKTGAKIPPIVVAKVDNKPNVLIDGLHRLEAYKKLGKEEILAEDLGTMSHIEAFAEAVKRNITHGKRLSFVEKLLAYKKLKDGNWSVEKISGVLYIPKVELKEYVAKRIVIDNTGEEVVLRAPVKHLVGIEKVGDMSEQKIFASQSQLNIIQQLTIILENDWLDTKNESVMDSLTKLKVLIEQALTVYEKSIQL